MAQTHTDTSVNQLIINKLNKQEFNNLQQVSDTELYLVEEQVDSVVTQGSTNPVQSGAVYDAIQDNHEIIFCHMLSGAIFNEPVQVCTEINGEIFDQQELIDRPNDPRPLFPDGNYHYATNTNKVYGGEVGDSEFIDVTASVMIVGDETKLYCDIDDNKLYRYDETEFIMVGGGGVTSYNDLSNKPLSVENSKVKYTLSDGTTKLTLAQESDLKTVAFTGKSIDCYDLKVVVADYKCCLIADIDVFYRSPSSIEELPFQGFTGRILKTSGGGRMSNVSAEVSCCVSQQNTDTEYHFEISSSHSDIQPCIVLYNNKYYLCIDKNIKIVGNNMYMYGFFKNCLNTPLIVNSADCTVVRNWNYSIKNATTSQAGLMSADDKKKVKQINNFTINAPESTISSNTAFGIMCYNLDLANFKVSISGDWSTGTFGQVNFGVSGRRTYGYFIEKNGLCVSKSTYTINIGEYNSKLYIYAKFSGNYKSAISVLINGLSSDSDFTNLNFEILNESQFSNIKSIQITSL